MKPMIVVALFFFGSVYPAVADSICPGATLSVTLKAGKHPGKAGNDLRLRVYLVPKNLKITVTHAHGLLYLPREELRILGSHEFQEVGIRNTGGSIRFSAHLPPTVLKSHDVFIDAVEHDPTVQLMQGMEVLVWALTGGDHFDFLLSKRISLNVDLRRPRYELQISGDSGSSAVVQLVSDPRVKPTAAWIRAHLKAEQALLDDRERNHLQSGWVNKSFENWLATGWLIEERIHYWKSLF